MALRLYIVASHTSVAFKFQIPFEFIVGVYVIEDIEHNIGLVNQLVIGFDSSWSEEESKDEDSDGRHEKLSLYYNMAHF